MPHGLSQLNYKHMAAQSTTLIVLAALEDSRVVGFVSGSVIDVSMFKACLRGLLWSRTRAL